MKYLVMDCETGGFEGTSLLSFYFGVLDEDFNVLDELDLLLRPKDHIYHINPEALEVNKINLIEHDKKAIPYNEGGTLLFNFLQQHSAIPQIFIPAGTPVDKLYDDLARGMATMAGITDIQIRPPTIEKLEPLGHNVSGDIRRVKEDLVSEGSWNKFVSYRVQDTGTVGNFLKKQGKIPKEISGSLSSYCDHFKIDRTEAHTAKGDCIMTALVYKEMLKL